MNIGIVINYICCCQSSDKLVTQRQRVTEDKNCKYKKLTLVN